MTNAC